MNKAVVCLVGLLIVVLVEVGAVEVASGAEDAAPAPTEIVTPCPDPPESNATATATMQPPQTEPQPQTSLAMM